MKKWNFALCVCAAVLAVLETICILLRLTNALPSKILILFDDILTVLLPLLWFTGIFTILAMYNKDLKKQ